jgi:hypothetical protein
LPNCFVRRSNPRRECSTNSSLALNAERRAGRLAGHEPLDEPVSVHLQLHGRHLNLTGK